MELVLLPISEIHPYAHNSRVHPQEQLEKLAVSIRSFGIAKPILLDEKHMILAGHGIYEAAQIAEKTEIPCVINDTLTEEQKRAYIIADNRLTDLSHFDMEIVTEEMKKLLQTEFDVSLMGFNDIEIEKLLAAEVEIAEDDFDMDTELGKPPITRAGDVWLLGRHRLICGDSTKSETYDILMDGKRANLIVTDPPYNVDYEGAAGKIVNDNLSDDAFYHFLRDAFRQMHRVLDDNGSIYVFHAETEGLNFRKAYSDAGFYLSGCCVWCKPSLVLGHSPYQWQHEPILFGWKKKGKHRWYADRKQTTVWEFDRPQRSEDHPTMKPVALMEYPIENSSKASDIVLDPFGGSGSTLIACEQTGRNCCMAELDEKYADVIVKRYIEYKGNSQDVYVLRDETRASFAEIDREINGIQ